jgi:hypothetical protein
MEIKFFLCLLLLSLIFIGVASQGANEAAHVGATGSSPVETPSGSEKHEFVTSTAPPPEIHPEGVTKEPEIHDLLKKLREEETELKNYHNEEPSKTEAVSNEGTENKSDDPDAEESNLLQNVDNLLQDIQKNKIIPKKRRNAQKQDEEEYEDEEDEEDEKPKNTKQAEKQTNDMKSVPKVESSKQKPPQVQHAQKSPPKRPPRNIKPIPKVPPKVQEMRKPQGSQGEDDKEFYKNLKAREEEVKLGISKPLTLKPKKMTSPAPKKKSEKRAAHDARVYKDINHVFQSVLALYKEFVKFKKQTKIKFLKERLQQIKVRNELMKEIDVLKANVYHHQDLRVHGDYRNPDDFHHYEEKSVNRGAPDRNPHFKDEL